MTTTEEITSVVDKVGNDLNKLLIEGLKAKSAERIWMWIAIIAIIFIIFAFGFPAVTDFMASKAAQKIAENATQTTQIIVTNISGRII